MATALASMLFKPVVSGFKNEAQYIKDSVRSKPLTLDRLTDVPSIMGAFGRGFIGMNDREEKEAMARHRAPNNNHSNRGRQL
eukprot:COSAG05_NODE_3458_length_2049_cov_0.952821_6_plen_82_part_00